MGQPLPDEQLEPRYAGAFAQHYGLPTQVFDFTADLDIAVFFAGDSSGPPFASGCGHIAVLDVSRAEKGPCDLFDLRGRPESQRAQKQKAFGLIHSGFYSDDFEDLKRPEIKESLGLSWFRFAHCPGEHLFLKSLCLPADLLDYSSDEYASIPQRIIDRFVNIYGPLRTETARILARLVPHIGRDHAQSVQLWSDGPDEGPNRGDAANRAEAP
jgi:hypothetical protein